MYTLMVTAILASVGEVRYNITILENGTPVSSKVEVSEEEAGKEVARFFATYTA